MIAVLLLATTVLLPDGSPAGGARATPLAKVHFAHVVGTSFQRPLAGEILTIGADGFLDVTSETAGRWVILHPAGWADTSISADTAEVRLAPWHTVSGVVATPISGEVTVSYHRLERPRRPDDKGSVFWTSTAPVSSDGTYSIPHVPDGPGSVGLLREVKNERRVFRWRDYPRMVNVPSGGPLNLARGSPVSGRIMADKLPAIITLAPVDRMEAACHAVTDDDGRFEIPGVLPGAYRLTARPDRGSGILNIPRREIEVGTEPLDLGEIRGGEPDVETDRRVEVPDGLIERVRAEAAKHAPLTFETIWLGELTHPTGNYGARVTFRPEAADDDPTAALQWTLLIHIPGEQFRKYYPEHDSLGYGFRFSNEAFEKVSSFDRPLRVFPLRAETLHLPLEDGVTYDDALALLLAIESGAIRSPEPERKTTSSGAWSVAYPGFTKPPPECLPLIRSIRVEAPGSLRIETREFPFGGKFYIIQKSADGGFEITGGGSWVA